MSLGSPNGVVHHLLNFISYYVIEEGEPLEMDDKNMRQPPHRHLLGGLSVLLALRAIPTEESNTPLQPQTTSITMFLYNLFTLFSLQHLLP